MKKLNPEETMNFDIVILGGGLVGASLACALIAHGFNIALLDKSVPDHSIDEVKAKALALSLYSTQYLASLGIWQQIHLRAEPLRSIHVSVQGQFGMTCLNAQSSGLKELGAVINADVLNACLNQTLEKQAGSNLTLLRPNTIRALSPQYEIKENREQFSGWKLTLDTGKTLYTKLLVAADGIDSCVRQDQGIEVVVHDYQSTAIVTNLQLSPSRSHDHIAYERFLKNGSIALLPFGEQRVKCVWVMPSEEAEAFLAHSTSIFLDKVQEIFGQRLGPFVHCGPRIPFRLKSMRATQLYGQGFVLIGNAANTLHPVAAQGFNLGLRDVSTLARILIHAKHNHYPLNGIELLQAYAGNRADDHSSAHQFTHRLTQGGPSISMGILACEWIPAFKQHILQTGMGVNDG